MADMNTLVQTTIPTALKALTDSHNSIQQIATYCRGAYTSGDQNQVYDQTRNYTKDALLNVAYHIQTLGTHVSALLDAQANEIDKLDIQIRTISDRVKTCHDATGALGFRAKEGEKVYQKGVKAKKLEGAQLPEAAKPLRKYVRTPINYTAVEAGQPVAQAQSVYVAPAARQSVYNASPVVAPPPSLSAPPALSAPPTLSAPSFAAPPPPPPSFGAPPPPSFGAPPPPSFGAPPPPPMDFGGMPPPPPMSFDMPPPPSFGDLPPPPPFDMPPPPPPF